MVLKGNVKSRWALKTLRSNWMRVAWSTGSWCPGRQGLMWSTVMWRVSSMQAVAEQSWWWMTVRDLQLLSKPLCATTTEGEWRYKFRSRDSLTARRTVYLPNEGKDSLKIPGRMFPVRICLVSISHLLPLMGSCCSLCWASALKLCSFVSPGSLLRPLCYWLSGTFPQMRPHLVQFLTTYHLLHISVLCSSSKIPGRV